MNRQQQRQQERLEAREKRTKWATDVAAAYSLQYSGFNRKARRDVIRAMRRRNDGRLKQFPKVAS